MLAKSSASKRAPGVLTLQEWDGYTLVHLSYISPDIDMEVAANIKGSLAKFQ